MMKKLNNWMNKPITWKGFSILYGVLAAISTVALAIYWYWDRIIWVIAKVKDRIKMIFHK